MRKGSKHSVATRIKMSKAWVPGRRGSRLGQHMKESEKEHLRQIMTGKKHSKRTIQKIKAIAIKFANSKEWRKKVSDGTKRAYKRKEVKDNVKKSFLNRGHGNRWNGGVSYKANGYKLLYKPTHPNRDKRGYIMEHRFIMSEHLKRPLNKQEVVHHIDQDITNNDIRNLQLFKNKSSHRKHHASLIGH